MSGQYDRIVEPGQSGKIPVRVSTGHGTGPMSKSVSVFTNAKGPGSMVTLQIKGVLWQAIEATPNMASFGNIASSQFADASMIRKLTIVNNLSEPATLSSVTSTNPAFKAEIAVLEPGKKFELTVKLDKPSASGVQAGSITMNTGLTEKPTLQVAVNAYILADVDVVPNKIMLPKDRTSPIQRDLYVRNNSKKPIKVSDIRASDPQIKVTMLETQPGMAFNLKLDIPPEYKVPAAGDTITMNTDNPAYPVISVPVSEVPFPASSFQAPQPTAQQVPKPVITPVQPAAGAHAPAAGAHPPAAGVAAPKPAAGQDRPPT